MCIRDSPLPVRWMAPEAISHMNLTTASDVWSFAVVLWEIFSYGSRPFFGLSNYQAMEHILDNDLLPCPDNCPKQIFQIMIDCWQVEANSRPVFAEIYNKLKSMSDIATTHPSSVRMQYSPDISSTHAPDMPLHPSDVQNMHPQSMSSMTPPSIRHCQRDAPLGSYRSSMHSRHSSNPSVNSAGHHHPAASLHSASMASQPRSMPSTVINGVQRIPSMRSGVTQHSTLPRDGYHSLNRGDHHAQQNAVRDGHHG